MPSHQLSGFSRKGILEKLAKGDRRSIGPVEQVVKQAKKNRNLLPVLIEGLLDESEVVRMRCADAIEKLSREDSDWLDHHAEYLLEVATIPQQEIRWHMAQILPRVSLNRKQTSSALNTIRGYLKDKSSIVKTFALQALTDFSEKNTHLRSEVRLTIESSIEKGTPAMKARGRKLLKQLEKGESNA